MAKECRRPAGHPTRHRSARYVLGAGRAVAGLVGGLESSVATELTTTHPSPPPPHSPYIRRSDRDDSDVAQRSPRGHGSCMGSSRDVVSETAVGIRSSRDEPDKILSRTPLSKQPQQGLQPALEVAAGPPITNHALSSCSRRACDMRSRWWCAHGPSRRGLGRLMLIRVASSLFPTIAAREPNLGVVK